MAAQTPGLSTEPSRLQRRYQVALAIGTLGAVTTVTSGVWGILGTPPPRMLLAGTIGILAMLVAATVAGRAMKRLRALDA